MSEHSSDASSINSLKNQKVDKPKVSVVRPQLVSRLRN